MSYVGLQMHIMESTDPSHLQDAGLVIDEKNKEQVTVNIMEKDCGVRLSHKGGDVPDVHGLPDVEKFFLRPQPI